MRNIAMHLDHLVVMVSIWNNKFIGLVYLFFVTSVRIKSTSKIVKVFKEYLEISYLSFVKKFGSKR